MRIQATVKLTNRDVNMSTKPVRTSIAFGKKPLASSENSSDPKVFMMLCTAANRAGTKFSVCGNIDRVFDKFLDQILKTKFLWILMKSHNQICSNLWINGGVVV